MAGARFDIALKQIWSTITGGGFPEDMLTSKGLEKALTPEGHGEL